MVLDLPFFFFIVAVPSIEYPWHGHTHLHHYTMYCISRVLRVYWYVMIWFIIWMCVLCGRSSGNLLFSWLLPLASPTFSIENKSYRFLCSIPTHTHHWNLPFLLLLLQLFIIKKKNLVNFFVINNFVSWHLFFFVVFFIVLCLLLLIFSTLCALLCDTIYIYTCLFCLTCPPSTAIVTFWVKKKTNKKESSLFHVLPRKSNEWPALVLDCQIKLEVRYIINKKRDVLKPTHTIYTSGCQISNND